MGQVLLLLVVALTVAAVVFGVTVLVTGSDPGLGRVEPDGRAVPLPGNRPLLETDVGQVRFDMGLRGYRMAQVDQALRRAAYDIGYKDELIGVLQAEVTALREGRLDDADVLRQAREAALAPVGTAPARQPNGASAGATASGPADPEPSVGSKGDAPSTGGPGTFSADATAVPTVATPEKLGRLEFPRLDLDRPQPADRTEPVDRAGAVDRDDRVGTVDVAGAADRAPVGISTSRSGSAQPDHEDPAAPTRPLRSGGSVIEAEDGDLAAPTRPVRSPAATPEPAGPATEAEAEPEVDAATRPTGGQGQAEGVGATDGAEPGGDAATRRIRGQRQAEGVGSTDGVESEDEATRRIRRPMQASAPAEPSGPAEHPERM